MVQGNCIEKAQLEFRLTDEKARLEARLTADKMELETRLSAENARPEARLTADKMELEFRLSAEKAEFDPLARAVQEQTLRNARGPARAVQARPDHASQRRS